MFSLRRAGSLIAATTTTALVLSGTTLVAYAAEADQVKIRVANITDFHGRLEANLSKNRETGEVTPKKTDEMGAANVAGIINYIREQNPNTIVTTSGDNQGGSAFISAINKDDQPTMDFIKAIGTHGTAIGNHEFDKGYNDLKDRIIPGTQVGDEVTQLGANIFYKGERETRPYRIIEVDGVKVALVGTTSNLTIAKSNPANVAGVDITDSAEQVNIEAKKLKDAKEADVVIALIHDPAKEAAAKLNPEVVDFVFGGDSHVRTLDNKPATGVPYAQSYEYGKVVTDLDFTYDKATGKIVELEAKQYDATNLKELEIQPDPTVAEIVAEAQKQAEVLGKEVVATIGADFKRGSNPGDAPGTNRGTESTANNMIAESALIALEEFLKEDIDLGIMNAGGVREDLTKGEVTYEQAFKVQPFGNSIDVATLSGAAIKEALENQWQTKEQADKSGRPRLDMGLSDNVSYIYNPDAPRGEKITHITIDGKPLEMDKKYRVAGSSFLFDGGDKFIDKNKVEDQLTVGYNDLQAFIDYLKSGKAKVREGQKDVGVVLPEGGLKVGENEIKLSSLSYSSDGEPQAKTVTVKIGKTEVTADVDNSVTDADKGLGEQGRATVKITLPEGTLKDETLTITTDANTNVSMPVTVAGGKDRPATQPENPTKPADKSSVGEGDVNIGIAIAAVVGVLSVLALVFAFPIDQLLGPIAYFGR